MSKVVIFSPYTPKFFDALFLGIPNFLGIPKIFCPLLVLFFPHIPNKASSAYYFLPF